MLQLTLKANGDKTFGRAPTGLTSSSTEAEVDAYLSNLAFTALFDPTNLTTPGGRAFLHKLGGAAGDEIADEYVKVLAATGCAGSQARVAARRFRDESG